MKIRIKDNYSKKTRAKVTTEIHSKLGNIFEISKAMKLKAMK